MEPSHLPLELFNQVISHNSDRKTHLRTLCSYSLVSHSWNSRVSSHLYSRWLYDGEIHSISSLWKFLRSILCNKKIAHQVHEVNIRDWKFGLVHTHGRLVLSEGDLDLVRNAVHAAGLERIENSIMEGVRKADPRSLMALLLASLPNIITLYAQLPKTDTFLAEVLRKAAASQHDKSNSCSLRSLRQAHFTSAWNYRAKNDDDDDESDDDDENDGDERDAYHLKLDYLWPIFHLPTVHRLSLFDFDILGAADLFSNSPNTSNITDLTLVHRRSSQLKPSDFLALLALPRALTSLSIYLGDSSDWILYFEDHRQLSNIDLWRGICQHKDTLERLDIYRDRFMHQVPFHTAGNSHFGLMQGFRCLKHLHVQPEALGGCCRGNLAPFSLVDTLPVQLESLTFYGDEGLIEMRTLGQQLEDVITGSGFQRLGCITLEDTEDLLEEESLVSYQPPHRQVWAACRESGKQYEEMDPWLCTKGGAGRRYYRYVEQKRQRMKKKLKRVRFALTEYLESMENGMPEDGADGRHLSSDDLDTYEPPWQELTLESLYGEVDADEFFEFSGIDLDNFLDADEDDWDDMTEQLDQFHWSHEEDDSLETYFEMEEEFDMDNASVSSDGVW